VNTELLNWEPFSVAKPSDLGIFGVPRKYRAVAQLGSALEWGSRGRGFESRRPDTGRSQELESASRVLYRTEGMRGIEDDSKRQALAIHLALLMPRFARPSGAFWRGPPLLAPRFKILAPWLHLRLLGVHSQLVLIFLES
jgi:hypothetical protein